MVSQTIPFTASVRQPVGPTGSGQCGSAWARLARALMRGDGGALAAGVLAGGPAVEGGAGFGDEPLPVEFYQPPRPEGAGLGAGAVSGGADEGWVRGALCAPGPRSAGPRRRRPHAAERDRQLSFDLAPLFGRAGPPLDRAFGNERDPQARSGGAGHP